MTKRLPNGHARSTQEWVGATPDTPAPPHVRLRVFKRYHGRCHISGRKIQAGEPWQLEHIIALANWTGEGHGNRESNMAPALEDKHKGKTAEDRRIKAAADRAMKKHIGIKKKPKGRPMPGTKASNWKQKVGGGWERRT